MAHIRSLGIYLADFYRANRFPIQIFLITRVVLFLVVYLSLLAIPMREGFENRRFNDPNTHLFDGWTRWDSGWYMGIARDGYQYNLTEAGTADIAFFPLYPISIKLFLFLFGNLQVASVVAANTALFFGLIVLYKLILKLFDEKIANYSVLYLIAFPFSIFFSAAYTESLFLLVTCSSLLFAYRQQWLLAGIFAALAGATRLHGILVTLLVLVIYLQHIRSCGRLFDRKILFVFVGFSGTLSYFAYLYLTFNLTPADYLQVQFAWNVNRLEQFNYIINLIATRGIPGATDLILILVLFSLAFFFIFTFINLVLYRKLILLNLWGLISVFVSLGAWQSAGRYMIIAFPLFISAAILTVRFRINHQAIILSLASLQIFFAILFSHWYWVG